MILQAQQNQAVLDAIRLGASLKEQSDANRARQAALAQASSQAVVQDSRRAFEFDRRLEFDRAKEANDTARELEALDIKRKELEVGRDPFTWMGGASPAGVPVLPAGAPSAPAGGTTPAGVPEDGVDPYPNAPLMLSDAPTMPNPPSFSGGGMAAGIGNLVSDAGRAAGAAAVPALEPLPPLPGVETPGGLPPMSFAPESKPPVQTAAAADDRMAQIDQAGQFFAAHKFPAKIAQEKMGQIAAAVLSKPAPSAEANMEDFALKQGLKRGDDGKWTDAAGQLYDVGIGKSGKAYSSPAKASDFGLKKIDGAPDYLQDPKTRVVYRSVTDPEGKVHLLRAGGEFQGERVAQAGQRLELAKRNQLFNEQRAKGMDVAKAERYANDSVLNEAKTAQKALEDDFDQQQKALYEMRMKGWAASSNPAEIGQFRQQEAITMQTGKNRDEARRHTDMVQQNIITRSRSLADDPVTAARILKEAGGDKVKATKIATERGFSE